MTGMNTISLKYVAELVATEYGMTLAEIKKRGQYRSLAWPRQEAMTLQREYTNWSLAEIGRWWGGYDHTTVIHAQRAVYAREKSLPEVLHRMMDFRDALDVYIKPVFIRHQWEPYAPLQQ